MRYEAVFRNLTLGQAKAMYRVALNLADEEDIFGDEGLTWSGIIPGQRHLTSNDMAVEWPPAVLPMREERTITIQPMVGEIDKITSLT